MVSWKIKIPLLSILLVAIFTGLLPILISSFFHKLLVLMGFPETIKLGFLEWSLSEISKSFISAISGFVLGFFIRKIIGW